MKFFDMGHCWCGIICCDERLRKIESRTKDSFQQTTTPVQLVANANPLTANTPKQ